MATNAAKPKRTYVRKPKADAGDFNGADPAKFDHDQDGKPGGSKVRTLTEHELTGLFAEAFEAYDYQDQRIRFDSLGRKWTFQPEKRDEQSELLLRVENLINSSEDHISSAILAADLGRDMVESVVRVLDDAL